MHIVKLSVFLLFFCLIQTIEGQIVSRVTFPVDAQQTRDDLAEAGLDLTHGHGKLTSSFTTTVRDYELKRLDQLGIRYTIDIPDLNIHRKQLQASPRGGLLECQDDFYDVKIPANFEYGSVGGYFSLPEIIDQLDAMALAYPAIISVRKPIGNYKTWKNNSIFWVRISDQPETDENEPEILYTSLLHAREFASVSQNIFYMWYLLENYEKDPLIKQIIDHTELYFIPVANPDGLNYNVQGYESDEDVFTRDLRKNMRDNDNNGVFDPEKDGVDLNRNFGAFWGHDDMGSSPFPGSDVYRGPYPFSEPETQAIRDFCNEHDFKLALNHHTYGNLLVYPWGYNNKHTADSVAFGNYSQLLTSINRYVYGLGEETVGYKTNGDSDDWMYDAHGTLAMTPETGDTDDDFYPPQNRIITLCKSTLYMNVQAARIVNSLIDITDESPAFIQPGPNSLQLEFNRYGLLSGEVLISFKALSPSILQVPAPIVFDLDMFEAHERNLIFQVDAAVPYGSTVSLEVICQQGDYTFRDTISKVRADFFTLTEDTGDLNQWDRSEGESWGTTNAAYKTGPVSITDSPEDLYGPNISQTIMLRENIDLGEATEAYAQFWARWDIEDHYDFVVFQASTDGQNWVNLCGERSKLGDIFQAYEEPLYDGKQTQWVLETVDLQSYLGQQVQLRFMIITDGFVFKDGFYFDDFSVITIRQNAVSTEDFDASLFKAYPNPASNNFVVEIPELTKPSIAIYNLLGQKIYESKSIAGNRHEVSSSTWQDGIYHYVIYADGSPAFNGTISCAH